MSAAMVVVLAPLLAAPVADAPAQEDASSTSATLARQQGSPVHTVLFIIDLSGSMNQGFGSGQTRLEVAKERFIEAFDRIRDTDTAVGVRVYGDQLPSRSPSERQENCETDTRLAVPVGTGNREEIIEQVGDLEAVGDTPIALALEKATSDLPPDGSASVVLFSDGQDECYDADLDGDPEVGPSWGRDPCQVAAELQTQSAQLGLERIHTIAFGTDEASLDQLRCISDATGGTFVDARTPADAERLADTLVQLGTPRDAVRLGGTPIEGTPNQDGAPDLDKIGATETAARYTDTIAINEERWYRIADYGPGTGDTTVTVFDLPPREGTSLSLRMVPGPDEDISGGLTEERDNVGVPLRPSASVRCGGCEVRSSEEHELFWVVALRAEDPTVNGTFDLELLLEGPAWGGTDLSCGRYSPCWYESQIEQAQTRLAASDEGPRTDERIRLQDDNDELEALIATRQAKLSEIESAGGTSWRLPIALVIIGLASAAAATLVSRRSQPTRPGVGDHEHS